MKLKDLTSTKRFFIIHLLLLFPLFSGYSHAALIIFLVTYFIRAFGVIAVMHRYFAHRSFKTSRWFQFILALVASTANQRGPIWWASVHRHHHKHSDQKEDVHSPVHYGFWHSHIGWLFNKESFKTKTEYVKDWQKYPELQFFEKYYMLAFIVSGVIVTALGSYLHHFYPELGTNGFQFFSWGFVLSTLTANHMTLATNSLVHMVGSRRYKTDDSSRNVWWFFPALGANWHNNHHCYPNSAKSGHAWYEFDLIFLVLKSLGYMGLIWDIKATYIVNGETKTKILFKRSRAKKEEEKSTIAIHSTSSAT